MFIANNVRTEQNPFFFIARVELSELLELFLGVPIYVIKKYWIIHQLQQKMAKTSTQDSYEYGYRNLSQGLDYQ